MKLTKSRLKQIIREEIQRLDEEVKPRTVRAMEKKTGIKAEYEPHSKSWELMNGGGVAKWSMEYEFWEFYKNGQFKLKLQHGPKAIKIAKQILN